LNNEYYKLSDIKKYKIINNYINRIEIEKKKRKKGSGMRGKGKY
jgi:hypothetical protein